METKKFSKNSLNVDEQVEFLQSQGLIIDDREKAKQVLSIVSYYRLSGYMLPFKKEHNNNKLPRSFKPNITFDKIWQIYQFDRELRLLVMDAIEKIEVALRGSITNVMSTKINPFWYIDPTHYKLTKQYKNLMQNIDQIIKNKNEIYIQHYYKKYTEPSYPPAWMIMEALTFGACSKLFKNIKKVGNKKAICSIFNQQPCVIDSWMRTLAYTRNICAHHARLWNRWLVCTSLISKKDIKNIKIDKSNNRKFIIVAYITQKLLKEIAPKSLWKNKLFNLFEKYETFVDFSTMGFSKKWRNDLFWKL